ncbi:MAG TPA: ribonuclease H-like domain-containing protein [Candidatus Acidoferrum sp.]|nr:ribonuclease H-like domain-containing protein [Candidatus Acidoferrum sp.]
MSPADKFARLAALKPAHGIAQRPAALRAPDETDALSRLLGAGIARNHYGEHLAIRNWFATPEFSEPSPVTLDLLTRATAPQDHPGRKERASESGRYKPKSGQDKPKSGPPQKDGPYKGRSRDESVSRRTRAAVQNTEKWLFLDTETTGLAGGTGTYAFLVGLAWWDAGGLQVEQLFLRDFSEEHSLLQELAARLAERPVLVTFNGKSFDWPLLENRFMMTRAIRVPSLAAHLDLLHPARALWKLRLGSVRLVELERHVLDAARLGWHREDDVSSALIPQYYFDYLRGGSAKPLAGVVKHNQMDLRGLAALFGKINSLLDEREAAHEAADSLDLFGLSRYLHRRGENERAHSMCAQALGAGLPAEFRPQATRELAIMARRRGDVERAASLWHELVHDPQDGVAACEHLAIHYERNARDLQRAVQFAQLALAKLHRQCAHSRDPYAAARAARAENKLLCRLERLRHRIERSAGGAHAPLLGHSAAAGKS